MYKIAISGKAGSGKNTLSRAIVKELRLRNKFLTAKYIAFADPIKKIILSMYPDLPKKYLFGSSKYRYEVIPNCCKNNNSVTIRQLLQDLGEGCKIYNTKIWVEAFDNTLKKSVKNNIIIASDLRFIDEFNYLRKNKFYIIRIVRNGLKTMSHVSETQQNQIKDEEFDKIIFNDGSLNDLKSQVKEVVELLTI